MARLQRPPARHAKSVKVVLGLTFLLQFILSFKSNSMTASVQICIYFAVLLLSHTQRNRTEDGAKNTNFTGCQVNVLHCP